MEEVSQAITYYETLVDEYPQPESWASNLRKAIGTLKHSIERTNFYRYLFNPKDYTFKSEVETITKQDAIEFDKQAAAFDKENAHTKYSNGSKVKIVYGKKIKDNGKSLVRSSEIVQEEKSWQESEGCNESSLENL